MPAITITHVGTSGLKGYVSGPDEMPCHGLSVFINDPGAVAEKVCEDLRDGQMRRIVFSVRLHPGVEIEEYQTLSVFWYGRFYVSIRTIGSGRENLCHFPPGEEHEIIKLFKKRPIDCSSPFAPVIVPAQFRTS